MAAVDGVNIVYIDYVNGDDSRSRATALVSTTPMKSLTHFKAVMNSGDWGYVQNTAFQPEAVDFTGKGLAGLIQWPGQVPATIQGVVRPPAASWINSIGNVWVLTLAAGLHLQDTVVKSATSLHVLNSGSYAGMGDFLALNAGAGITVAANEWDYNSTTGVWAINTNGAYDPTTLTGDDRVGYCIDAQDLTTPLIITGGALLDGISFKMNRGYESGTPVYGVLGGGSGTGTLLRNLTAYMHRTHGFVTESGSSIESCVSWGCSAGPDSAGSGINFGMLAAGVDFDGEYCLNCTAHMYQGFYLKGGNPTQVLAGMTIHGGAGVYVNNYQITNFNAINEAPLGDGAAGTVNDVTDIAPAGTIRFPVDPTKYSQYPIRSADGQSIGISYQSIGANMAFRNRFIDMHAPYAGHGAINTPSLVVIGDGDATAPPTGDGISGNTVLYEGCTILYSSSRGYIFSTPWYLYAGSHLIFKNCTLIDFANSSYTNAQYGINIASTLAYVQGTAGAKVSSYQSIWARANQTSDFGAADIYFMLGDTSATILDFRDNVYVNYKSTTMAQGTGRTTQAAWLANVDLTGTFLSGANAAGIFSNASSIDPAVAGVLATSSSVYALRKNAAIHTDAASINGRAYSGLPGSWQDGNVVGGGNSGTARRLLLLGGARRQ